MANDLQPFQAMADGMKSLAKIHTLAWPNGAEIYCNGCLRRERKTQKEMEALMSGWPKCCRDYMQVKPL